LALGSAIKEVEYFFPKVFCSPFYPEVFRLKVRWSVPLLAG
jgi:hypothetical protein